MVCCSIGGIIRVRLIKKGLGKSVQTTRIRGGVGLRHPDDCGMNDELPDSFCRSRFAYEAHMVRVRAVLYDPCHRADLGDKYRVKVLEDLLLFEERFNSLIQTVMGEETERAHHVTRWAVLEYFRICTWNRAWAWNKTEYLHKDFDTRWASQFEQLVRLQTDGRTRQGMAGAMRFLCYYCPSPSCGSQGFCAEFCADCERDMSLMKATRTSGSEGGISHAERTKQFAAWKLKQPAASPSTRAAFDKAHPRPTPTSRFTKDAVVSLSTAMDFLSLKQEVVREPKSAAEL
jgi:hypothetical protein